MMNYSNSNSSNKKSATPAMDEQNFGLKPVNF
jgi:hypothetical protein